jgi:acyl dehydratase
VADQYDGPGVIYTDDVGTMTVSKTTLLDSRTTMAYASSINDANPRYFDDLSERGLMVHPAIAFSLQWASRFRPDQKIDPRVAAFGVHASTDLRIYRPFRAGEAVTTQGKLIQKRQISPGVYNIEKYKMVSSSGELIAELYYNGITRGGKLEGADAIVENEPELPQIEVFESESLWRREILVGLHAGQQYTECAQIYNPIHTEPSVARAAGLPDIILHGSATKAMALMTVVDECLGGDAERVTRLTGQLRGMVLMDSSIAVECLAHEAIGDEVRIAFRVLNDKGEPAISNGVVCARV